jgi:hypothetical protein
MVKHVIIWTLKAEFSDEEKRRAAEKIKSSLEGLMGKISGMTSVKVNIDLLPSSTGDVMLDTEFTDENALKAYQVNPDHVAAATYIRSVVSDRKCVDYLC